MWINVKKTGRATEELIKKLFSRVFFSLVFQLLKINNDYFTVEHSRDGIHFSPIGLIRGAGNSTVPLAYAMMIIKDIYILKQILRSIIDGLKKTASVKKRFF